MASNRLARSRCGRCIVARFWPLHWQKGANLAEGCKPGRRVQTWQKGANLAEGRKRCKKWVSPLHPCTFCTLCTPPQTTVNERHREAAQACCLADNYVRDADGTLPQTPHRLTGRA